MSAAPPSPSPEEFCPKLYARLRDLAARCLGGKRGTILQPTALVHEAFLKLARGFDARSETHYLAVAGSAMRQILLDHLRHRGRQKRGGDRVRLTLQPGLLAESASEVDAVDLEDALTRLGQLDERAARVVELKVFAGLTRAAIADELDVSERTVANDWSMARAWLRCEMGFDSAPAVGDAG